MEDELQVALLSTLVALVVARRVRRSRMDAAQRSTLFFMRNLHQLCLLRAFNLSHRRPLPVGCWFTDTVWALWPAAEFRKHFRLSRETFSFIVGRLETEPEFNNNSSLAQTDAAVQLAIVMFRLAGSGLTRSAAVQFNVSSGFVAKSQRRVLAAFLRVFGYFIALPAADELPALDAQFEALSHNHRHKLPGCIGALDGTHIPIVAPPQNRSEYVNRKGFFSIATMALVEADGAFRAVRIGDPGCMHDGRVLANSDLYDWIAGLPDRYHVLADTAYPLLVNLMTPFVNPLVRLHGRFNKVLSRQRVVVENAFGRLKMRWRLLLTPFRTELLGTVTLLVRMCCILHNLCQGRGDLNDADWSVLAPAEQQYFAAIADADDEERYWNGVEASGIAKRNDLVTQYMDFYLRLNCRQKTKNKQKKKLRTRFHSKSSTESENRKKKIP
eukprot:gnl/Spiro4/24289_TR12063_c1_g1_i1.p1 gnl/Spiro4/24289_TR12063_c1_g1~~gnl/Spiro4/24289_TR12063_c1_g1_i1.p1  ORF type:complete len:441 (+),score=77.26 gnl/Spiro4/24289_TR12063_c1_g1_i1:550-1872(+)